MRTVLHFLADAACAVLNVTSIAIAAGAIAAIFTHRLRDGLLVALGVFVLAGLGFAYSIWRTYRPRRRMFNVRRPWRTGFARGPAGAPSMAR